MALNDEFELGSDDDDESDDGDDNNNRVRLHRRQHKVAEAQQGRRRRRRGRRRQRDFQLRQRGGALHREGGACARRAAGAGRGRRRGGAADQHRRHEAVCAAERARGGAGEAHAARPAHDARAASTTLSACWPTSGARARTTAPARTTSTSSATTCPTTLGTFRSSSPSSLTMFSPGEALEFLEANEVPASDDHPHPTRSRRAAETLAQTLINRGVNLDPRRRLVQGRPQDLPVAGADRSPRPSTSPGTTCCRGAASMLPVIALAPKENEKVVDMAAFPGRQDHVHRAADEEHRHAGGERHQLGASPLPDGERAPSRGPQLRHHQLRRTQDDQALFPTSTACCWTRRARVWE